MEALLALLITEDSKSKADLKQVVAVVARSQLLLGALVQFKLAKEVLTRLVR